MLVRVCMVAVNEELLPKSLMAGPLRAVNGMVGALKLRLGGGHRGKKRDGREYGKLVFHIERTAQMSFRVL